ncbi:MAG: transcription initiation factor TFIID subunit 11 [Marteilia pararefringens]
MMSTLYFHKYPRFFVSQLSEEQLNQYECFRRATFPKPLIKKHISATTKCKNISQNVLIVLSGITKVLIGQIIDEAITLSELSGDCLPLKPLYIRSAYSNLLTRGEIPELLQDRNFNFE